MTDQIIPLMQDLHIAETSEPMLMSNPPQQTKHALLYRRALDGIRALKHRVDELLAANTRYLLRARKSEEYLVRAMLCMTTVCEDDVKLHDEIREYLKEPWR